MRGFFALCTLAIVVSGAGQDGEPAGAVAPGLRWCDPLGTPSGSRRSAAIPVVRQPVQAWSYKVPGPLIAPPVLWDGIVYLFYHDPKNRIRHLCALGLFSGKVLAEGWAPAGPDGTISVWENVVVFRKSDTELAGYKISGHTFYEVWTGRAPAPAGDPVVYDRDVWVCSPAGLLKFRLRGPETPVSRVRVPCVGRPALLGPYVYALEKGTDSPRILKASRESGLRASQLVLDKSLSEDSSRYAVRAFGENILRVVPPFDRSPDPRISLAGGRYCLLSSLADAKAQPDLFANPVPPVTLGSIIYFGGWAADLDSGQILWRLPLEKIRYPLVPADGILLAVTDDSEVVAFREVRLS